MLDALGLDETAEDVYRTLLAERTYGVDELCRALGLDEDRVRQALDQMFELALVRRSSERADGWRAVDPQVGLQRLLNRHNAELEQRRARIIASQAKIAELIADRAAAQGSGSSVEHVLGVDAVIARIEQHAENAGSEVLGITPGAARAAADLEAARRNNARVLERGVTIREIVQDACRYDLATAAHAQWLTEAGSEVRTAPTLPHRLLIIDRRIAFVPLDTRATVKGALQVTDPGLVHTLAAFFESVWNTAVPFGSGPVHDRHGLNPREREVLRLLASGLTDEAAAARLAVSDRTIRRIMNELCERLNAGSRFEAGIKAAQAGWLDA
ncbi:LuxR family transcriptional regulator [Actinospica sp. MGRD01-02]|uniref:LuxR family transcriptional regulator n=1 Tax=Actinospica acidithermotolerans TaxID=2828514 RepID=A0A941E884_9ACTN|nr:LuxR C-terminal-related transcriptional regulator [Actinospica acidithermotolerans]MBR7825723.1 LuxR family transcriptional regulator [Actinospica acidithermotolerans]